MNYAKFGKSRDTCGRAPRPIASIIRVMERIQEGFASAYSFSRHRQDRGRPFQSQCSMKRQHSSHSSWQRQPLMAGRPPGCSFTRVARQFSSPQRNKEANCSNFVTKEAFFPAPLLPNARGFFFFLLLILSFNSRSSQVKARLRLLLQLAG